MCFAIAVVWMLGSLQAELDQATSTGMQVDPMIVRKAILASEEYQRSPHDTAPRRASDAYHYAG